MQASSSHFDALPASALVRLRQLLGPAGPVPWSAATHWRKVAAGKFPRPVHVSERITAWRVDEVRNWLASAAKGGAR